MIFSQLLYRFLYSALLVLFIISFFLVNSVNATFLVGDNRDASTFTGTGAAGNYAQINKYTATASGTATSIHVLVNGTGYMDFALYSDNSNDPDSLLWSVKNEAVTTGWNEISISNITIVEGTVYWLGYVADNTSDIKYVAGTDSTFYRAQTQNTNWPDPWTNTDEATWENGLWLDGTLAPTPTITPTPTNTPTPAPVQTVTLDTDLKNGISDYFKISFIFYGLVLFVAFYFVASSLYKR